MPGVVHDPANKKEETQVGSEDAVNKGGAVKSQSPPSDQQSTLKSSVNDSAKLLGNLRMDDSFFEEPPAPVIQGGYNFDEWQWWKKREGISGPPTKEQLANPTSFEWAGDRAELEKTLFADGVVQLGRVSEEWLQLLEDFCATTPFNDVLSLGCERREDGYSACGEVLAAPWVKWMEELKHAYSYVSLITAFPTDGDDQGWHRDTPDNKESSDHQITLMIYITDVRVSNGATQFRRIASKDEVSFPGPRGSVVAFESSRTQHRGLANREGAPRVLLYVAFDD